MSTPRKLIEKAEWCRQTYRESLLHPAWSVARAELQLKSLLRFIDWFVPPSLSLADFHREWLRLFCLYPHVLLLAPRGHGKTTVTGWYALWRICVDPSATILLLSGNSAVSETLMRPLRAELESNPRIRRGFGPLGPPDAARWTVDELIVARPDRALKDSTVRASGLGAKIRGRRVVNGFVLADDIADEINSATPEARARLEDWLMTSVYPVLEAEQQLMVTGTRLHEADLYASLARLPSFHTSVYDAIVETPDGSRAALWPEKYPLAELDQRLADMGSFRFNQEYRNIVLANRDSRFPMAWFAGDDGRPGCFAPAEHLQRRRRPEDVKVVQAVDLAIGQSERADYFVILTLGLGEDGAYHLLDLLRDRLPFPDQVRTIVRLWEDFHPEAVIVETNAYQKAIADELARINRNIPVVPHTTTTQSKHDPNQGLMLLQPLIERGQIRFPRGDSLSEETTMVVVTELNLYPHGRHDDTVLALWMAARWLNEETARRREGKVHVFTASLADREEGDDGNPRNPRFDPHGRHDPGAVRVW